MALKPFIHSLRLGQIQTYRNLALHPLLADGTREPAYLTLAEALVTGGFRVEEVSFGGTVPELKVINKLARPVLMLDGEELVGAKQNRVLNLTVLVPAESELKIPVSCVEAGRWQHMSDSFLAADRAQFARGRARKLAQVSESLKDSGARYSQQSDVWDEISAKSARMAAHSPTGAMAAIYEHSRGSLDDFVRALPPRQGQVGAVFSIGGQVAGLDAFECAATYARVAAKLLRSYAVDALEAPAGTFANDDAAHAFMADVAESGVGRFKALGLGHDLRLEGLGLAGAALEHDGRIVHLVTFPAAVFADERPNYAHGALVRARTRRSFH